MDMTNVAMTHDEQIAYMWASSQRYNSEAARHARTLAKYIDRVFDEIHRSESNRPNTRWYVEADGFEGFAKVLGKLDGLYFVKSIENGGIYIVQEDDLIEEVNNDND